MSYDKVQVGNRIRGSRLEKGWTQERLAAEAEISVQQLRALEKGQRNLGVDHNESTCYNIAMAQVSVAQEGKLPEMHERLIILRELLTRAAPSSCGHCAFSS